MGEFKGVKNIFIREIPKEKLYLLNALIENGIEVEIQGENTLEWAIKHNDEEIVRQLVSTIDITRDNNKAIRLATQFSNEVIVKMILDAGADVTVNDNEPLINAIKKRKPEIVKLLLAAGANPVARNNLPILLASQYGNTQIFKMLV